jgi:type VI secretion system Hcp family effector
MRVKWLGAAFGSVVLGAVALMGAGYADAPEAGNPAASVAAFNIYLRLPGIEGEAVKRGHENWIQVTSFRWGVSQGAPIPGSRGARAAPSFSEITIVKHLDRSSPLLARTCAEGKALADAQLVYYGPSGTTVAPLGTIQLSNVRITSVMVESGENGNSGRPVETVTLSFGRVEWTYNEIDPVTGRPRNTVTTGWDLGTNRAITAAPPASR